MKPKLPNTDAPSSTGVTAGEHESRPADFDLKARWRERIETDARVIVRMLLDEPRASKRRDFLAALKKAWDTGVMPGVPQEKKPRSRTKHPSPEADLFGYYSWLGQMVIDGTLSDDPASGQAIPTVREYLKHEQILADHSKADVERKGGRLERDRLVREKNISNAKRKIRGAIGSDGNR